MRTFRLNVNTIETIDDIKLILDELALVTTEDSPRFYQLKKYFNIEVENQQVINQVECTDCESNGPIMIMPDIPNNRTSDPVSINGKPVP